MKWEYKSCSFMPKMGDMFGNKSGEDYYCEHLNKFGYEGWELVQIIYESALTGNHRAVFKRPLS